jgi:hypothetical protein
MNPVKQLFGIEGPVFDLKDEISFLDSLWRNDEVPIRLRFMAAAEVAKCRHATMKAVRVPGERGSAKVAASPWNLFPAP